jgi:hypothetical protein
MLAIFADDWTVKEKPSDVVVATPRGVKRRLHQQPEILSQRDVNELCAAAAKPATWRDPG